MKKKILLIMMLFITLSGNYKEEVKAASSLVFMETLSSTAISGPPEFSIPPKDITVKEGVVTTITTQITGTYPIKVAVYHDGEFINKAPWVTITTNQNIVAIVIKDTKVEHAGVYEIKALNDYGLTSATCKLTVTEN